jgi:hypothetical protein
MKLHRVTRGDIWDAGKYKDKDGDIIEKYPDGRERACPGVGREWIRVLLANLRKSGDVSCRGRGPAARWRFKGRKRSTSK